MYPFYYCYNNNIIIYILFYNDDNDSIFSESMKNIKIKSEILRCFLSMIAANSPITIGNTAIILCNKWPFFINLTITPKCFIHDTSAISILTKSLFNTISVLSYIFGNSYIFVFRIFPLTFTCSMHFTVQPSSFICMCSACVDAMAIDYVVFELTFVFGAITVHQRTNSMLPILYKFSSICRSILILLHASTHLHPLLPISLIHKFTINLLVIKVIVMMMITACITVIAITIHIVAICLVNINTIVLSISLSQIIFPLPIITASITYKYTHSTFIVVLPLSLIIMIYVQ